MPTSRVIFWDVDTQYDFMKADGKLYVPDAEQLIPNLRKLTDYAHGHGIRIVASADDHVVNHSEISANPDWKTTFPPHCLRGTPGQRKLALAGRPSEAMRRKRRLPVGIRRDLAVVDHVIIGAGHDADAVPVGVVGEFPEVRNQLLGVRHVQLAVSLHEVVLGVNVPEDDARSRHGTGNLDGGGLKRQRYRHLIARVLARAARAIGPHFERELLLLRHTKAKSQEEQGFARQPEDLAQTERARVHEQRFYEGFADAAPLLIIAHGEPGDLGKLGTVNLEATGPHEAAIRCSRQDVLLDVTAQIVVRARQEIARCHERRHQLFHRGDVRQAGGTELRPGADREAGHARTSPRIVTPRSRSSRVMVRGGTMRSTVGPAVRTRS